MSARCSVMSLAKRRAGGGLAPAWAGSADAGAGTLCSRTWRVSKPLSLLMRDRKHVVKTARTLAFEAAEQCKLLRPNSWHDTA